MFEDQVHLPVPIRQRVCYIESAMKHILANPYHLWANEAYSGLGAEDWAANPSRNRSFRGKSAYSYSTEVARIVRPSTTRRAYLLTSRSYSVTTNRHMREIRDSIPMVHREATFMVPSLDGNHQANIRYYSDRISEELGKGKRARLYKYGHYRDAVDLHNELSEYCAFFGLPFTPNPEVVLIEPRLEDIREADAARRTESDKRAHAEHKAKRAKKAERLAPILEAWKSGGPRDYDFNMLPTDYLRVSGENIETTRGAYVPLAHVREVLPAVLRIIQKGQAWTPVTGIKLGHYTLTGITEEGTVMVGCHKFTKDEVIRFAGTVPMTITDPGYWDCECQTYYIHPKSETFCERCRARQEDCPDSRTAEVQAIR